MDHHPSTPEQMSLYDDYIMGYSKFFRLGMASRNNPTGLRDSGYYIIYKDWLYCISIGSSHDPHIEQYIDTHEIENEMMKCLYEKGYKPLGIWDFDSRRLIGRSSLIAHNINLTPGYMAQAHHQIKTLQLETHDLKVSNNLLKMQIESIQSQLNRLIIPCVALEILNNDTDS